MTSIKEVEVDSLCCVPFSTKIELTKPCSNSFESVTAGVEGAPDLTLYVIPPDDEAVSPEGAEAASLERLVFPFSIAASHGAGEAGENLKLGFMSVIAPGSVKVEGDDAVPRAANKKKMPVTFKIPVLWNRESGVGAGEPLVGSLRLRKRPRAQTDAAA